MLATFFGLCDAVCVVGIVCEWPQSEIVTSNLPRQGSAYGRDTWVDLIVSGNLL